MIGTSHELGRVKINKIIKTLYDLNLADLPFKDHTLVHPRPL